MKNNIISNHSKREIVTAGKILQERLIEEKIKIIEKRRNMTVLEAFRIAHNWRDAHMRPLLRVRQELSGRIRRIEYGAVTAARMKRMASIRKKLQRPLTLYQIQDIAGCRAILRSMKEVNKIVKFYRDGESRHFIQSEDDYISNPKSDGYRSHHIIVKFNGSGDDAIYNRQTVEVQLRTRSQHAWATAVEAVGLIRRENIKGGEGSKEWRRFFELMSAEIAYEENHPLPPTTSKNINETRDEIIHISNRIKAVTTLEKYNKAIRFADQYGPTHSNYFILQFDYDKNEVHVEPFRNYSTGSEKYISEEETHSNRNTVLVEVNRVSDLKKAFPNYFLDVREFTSKLKKIISHNSGSNYDLSWLSKY
ncbi:RelA/SpoT domain-containing protein [Stappia indica]|uniref:RelA/SpoT domain-containing protein n=1 Tax=Stappia indica TaxID=538381 RepID=UPI001CD5FC47|nr:RelA/SpoT domain-containing protein [Stappia indica]MCA1300717.1 RelA/SpoT domain-containing protein [Stappia indica]